MTLACRHGIADIRAVLQRTRYWQETFHPDGTAGCGVAIYFVKPKRFMSSARVAVSGAALRRLVTR